MKKILFILLIGFVWAGCAKENEEAIPQCIQDRLVSFEANDACPSDASVKKYLFQGNRVYVFNPGGCYADQTREVLSGNCDVLGFLDGIAGLTDINGVEFDLFAEDEGYVWTN
ncbi:MAG: hypothetical protein QNK23_02790 [Crocinitomicaceae bacterium]|nr:hypothetical protein [Crocinitomicaceae bacterium]